MTSYQCGNLLKRTGGSDVEVFNSVFAENVSGRIVEEHVLSKIWCRGWYWLLCDECVKTMHAIGDRLFSDIQDKRTNKIRGLKTWTGRIDPPPNHPIGNSHATSYFTICLILFSGTLRHCVMNLRGRQFEIRIPNTDELNSRQAELLAANTADL